MPSLLLGPILRHVGSDDATVWVETDAACTVEVLGHRAETFCVDGHHYAIVVVGGLEPGEGIPYGVALDGERVWPPVDGDLPASVIRPIRDDGDIELVFGSCRTSLPHEPPYLQPGIGRERSHGIDALRALANRMRRQDASAWPDFLVMLGDQLYADQLSPQMREVTERRGGGEHTLDELCTYTEYALAYREAWGDPPLIRWLLSVLPTSMVFDDHEIHAQWKISWAWLEQMRSEGWYDDRIASGLSAYWVYQHLGNLSPAELREDQTYRRVREADDAAGVLRELALGTDRHAGHSRWSFCRDLGRSRLVVVDSRAGRELGGGERRMVDRTEWAWVSDRVRGDYDHLLLASSVPFFLPEGLHDLEAWTEAVGDGAWGERFTALAEHVRQGGVLDHWACFGRSFAELISLLGHLAKGGETGNRPHSIVLLSGDVHHCYLAEVELGEVEGERAPVWQAVCSPYRKQLTRLDRAAMRLGASRAGSAIGAVLARSARVPRRDVRWRLTGRPCYDNQLGVLELSGESAHLRVQTTVGSHWTDPDLRTRFEHRLA